MFDLEQAIQDWKMTFRPDGSIGADGVREVETHLRESIERLQDSGLSTHEAFVIGVHRMGSTTDLEAEFAKNQPVAAWRPRLVWMLAGYLVFTLCRSGATALVALTGAGMAYAGVDASIAGPIAVGVLVFAWVALLVISYRVLVNRDSIGRPFTWKWAIVVTTALYALSVASGFGQLAQQSLADLSWYGESATWLGWGGFVVRMVVYLFCMITLCRLSKPVVAVAE